MHHLTIVDFSAPLLWTGNESINIKQTNKHGTNIQQSTNKYTDQLSNYACIFIIQSNLPINTNGNQHQSILLICVEKNRHVFPIYIT